MVNLLNDRNDFESIDISDFAGVAARLPEQCREGVALAMSADLDELASEMSKNPVSNIVTLGMGASGIGGDILKALLEPEIDIPIVVNKGYHLPAFADKETLVIAVSYSGETEETLTTFEEALRRGSKVLVFASGGTLAGRAEELGLARVIVPSGMQPRAALGYLAIPILVAISRLGLATAKDSEINETLGLLDSMSAKLSFNTPVETNPAKQMAIKIRGMVPIIYGSEGGPAVAAFRWKCQINENSKSPAFWNAFPEQNHNEITGWQELNDVSKRFCLIELRSDGEGNKIAKRAETTKELIKDSFGDIFVVQSEGKSEIARLFSLMYLGDFTSIYLAVLYGVDPTPVERIHELKRRLKDID